MPNRSSAHPRRTTIHPLIVRLCHWIDTAAMIVMIMSGWAIHNAYPVAPFLFPDSIVLGSGQ